MPVETKRIRVSTGPDMEIVDITEQVSKVIKD